MSTTKRKQLRFHLLALARNAESASQLAPGEELADVITDLVADVARIQQLHDQLRGEAVPR
jgi:hypothetical protein